uniref:Uncharacterized protein n=1 Tax=Globodera rostochiensis TaxID=31243 RepID=A0A914HV06_GLORO
MHWKLIYLIAVYRAFAASVTEAEDFPAGDEKSKEREIGDHSLQQIKRVLNLTLKPIFGSKSVQNLLGRGEMEEANFDEMCGVVTALGFEKFANKLLSDKLTKRGKTNRLIDATVFDVGQKYKNFEEKLTNYLSLMNNLKASEEEEASEANVENMGAEKYSSEMFALFLFSRICEEMLKLTENNPISGQLLTTFEQMHSFKRDKIYEAASENKQIRIQLGQMNVAGKAFQIASLQIRLTLLEGIERPMTENEINSMIFDAENGEKFELISASKLLIDAFIEQEEMNGAKMGKFVQFLSKIKYLKLEELFTILLDSEFKYTAHKTSLVNCLNSVKDSIEQKFNTENLWEYLSKFKEFGLDIESLRKTEAKANEFANLSFYAKLYMSFFSQFFSGQKGKNVMEKCPKNFTEKLSPEEYVAYWLVEMRKDARNENIRKMKEKYAQEIKTHLAMAWTVNGTLMDQLPLEGDH